MDLHSLLMLTVPSKKYRAGSNFYTKDYCVFCEWINLAYIVIFSPVTRKVDADIKLIGKATA